MGLFDRKSKETPGSVVPKPPPTLSAADLIAASQLMDRWDAAMGNSDAMWACIEAFARVGGFRSSEATLQAGYEMGDSYAAVNQPWRWWAEAARLANAQGEYALTGRIFLFTTHFTRQIAPKMDWVTQAEVGLSSPSGGTYQDIARNAIDSLSHLSPNMLILNTARDKLDAASALRAARIVTSSTDA
jgi:hypothetical protein